MSTEQQQAGAGASHARTTEGQPAQTDQPQADGDQLDDTVQGAADKAGVKARVTARVEQRKQQLQGLGRQAQAKLGDRQQVKQLAVTVPHRARSNMPLLVSAGLVAITAVILVRRRRR